MKIKIPPKMVLPLVILAILVGSVITAYFFYSKYQKTQKLLGNPDEIAKVEIKTLVEKVGKLMELPADEQPTVATVIDASRLKDQPFFAKAENNDKVLLYSKAQKAILYRPKDNKIIEVAPINIGTQSATAVSPTPFPLPQMKIALYNGSQKVGITHTVETQLKEKFPNLEVAAKENAAKKDYLKTLVIDLTKKNEEMAQVLAQELNGEVDELPEGESLPKSPTEEPVQILIILAQP